MPTVASVDKQHGAVVGSASWDRLGTATRAGLSQRAGDIRPNDGCGPPMRPQRADRSGRHRLSVAVLPLVVGVLRRVERQGGFRGD